MKLLLLLLGFSAALLITVQLVLGLLILQDPASIKMRTTHQHSGYLTVAVSLAYITWSLATIASTPKDRKP
jgi:heme A synthase